MISSKTLFEQLTSQLTELYGRSEAQSIVYWLLDFYSQLSRTDILVNKQITDNQVDWGNIINRLLAQEPVQYVMGETVFYGRKFRVNSSVLIPRPETEELVQLVLTTLQSTKIPNSPLSILDIGTGSGCIAITLDKELAQAQVWAWDISDMALTVARKNAELNEARVVFEQQDVLEFAIDQERQFVVIVSNPPYVARSEASQMRPNVMEYEPHLALFVEDDDPLLFYKKIAQVAQHQLLAGGFCCVEINEQFGEATKEVFEAVSLKNVQIIKDIHGKERFVIAFQGVK